MKTLLGKCATYLRKLVIIGSESNLYNTYCSGAPSVFWNPYFVFVHLVYFILVYLAEIGTNSSFLSHISSSSCCISFTIVKSCNQCQDVQFCTSIIQETPYITYSYSGNVSKSLTLVKCTNDSLILRRTWIGGVNVWSVREKNIQV